LRLNKNKITAIPEGIASNNQLSIVELESNRISEYKSIAPLTSLPKLARLSLKGNPIASLPDYVQQIRKMFPHLVYLDGVLLVEGKKSTTVGKNSTNPPPVKKQKTKDQVTAPSTAPREKHDKYAMFSKKGSISEANPTAQQTDTTTNKKRKLEEQAGNGEVEEDKGKTEETPEEKARKKALKKKEKRRKEREANKQPQQASTQQPQPSGHISNDNAKKQLDTKQKPQQDSIKQPQQTKQQNPKQNPQQENQIPKDKPTRIEFVKVAKQTPTEKSDEEVAQLLQRMENPNKEDSGVKRVRELTKVNFEKNQARKVNKLLNKKKELAESIGTGSASTWD